MSVELTSILAQGGVAVVTLIAVAFIGRPILRLVVDRVLKALDDQNTAHRAALKAEGEANREAIRAITAQYERTLERAVDAMDRNTAALGAHEALHRPNGAARGADREL